MLVLLGIDSQFAMVDVLVAAALDEYPHIFRKGLLAIFQTLTISRKLLLKKYGLKYDF